MLDKTLTPALSKGEGIIKTLSKGEGVITEGDKNEQNITYQRH